MRRTVYVPLAACAAALSLLALLMALGGMVAGGLTLVPIAALVGLASLWLGDETP